MRLLEVIQTMMAIYQTNSNKSELDEVFCSDRVGQMQRGFVDLIESSEHSSTSDAQTSSEEVESFVYGTTKSSLVNEEILSVAIHDLKLSHRLSRAATRDITALLESFTENSTCWDYRTTQKWIQKQTGVKAVTYDCCRKSCMSFAMYPDKGECDYCWHPRWKDTPRVNVGDGSRQRVAFATYEYIPVVHRLRLWFADPIRAATMISYTRRAEAQANSLLTSLHKIRC